MDMLYQVRKIPSGVRGRYQISGNTGVGTTVVPATDTLTILWQTLTYITNGIVRDRRVFRVENPREFMAHYSLQSAFFECTPCAQGPG